MNCYIKCIILSHGRLHHFCAPSIAAFENRTDQARGASGKINWDNPPRGGAETAPAFHRNGHTCWIGRGRSRQFRSRRGANDAAVRNSLAPPLAHREPETRSLMGAFFFLFQRGLPMPSDLQRLAFPPKSVSERPGSLSIRPSWKSRRIQKVTVLQMLRENGLRRS
jgi:hypothetical protein